MLGKLETLIVSDILPNETTRLAHYLLPGCAHAEKRGTFTNTKGRVQKFMKAVEPPGDARPEWEFLHELVYNVTGQDGFLTIEGLFNQMAKEVPAFNGLTWAGLGRHGRDGQDLDDDSDDHRLGQITGGTVRAVQRGEDPRRLFRADVHGRLRRCWVERQVCAFIQDRHRARTGSGRSACCSRRRTRIKAFLKEDFTPAHVRKVYFWLAPAIVMIPSLLTVAIIPFGSQIGDQKMVIANLNVGILYTFGIVSLGVYGIVLAGYAANSKYPFLGGIRSSAQMISYEIAMGMSVIPLFLLVGGLNLSDVIGYQARAACLQLAGVQAAARVRHLPRRGLCRNQPHAVRSAGSRAGTGRRLQRRIQLHEIRAVLHGRIREHDPRVGDDGDAVLRRLDAAVVRARPAGGDAGWRPRCTS